MLFLPEKRKQFKESFYSSLSLEALVFSYPTQEGRERWGGGGETKVTEGTLKVFNSTVSVVTAHW